MVIALKAQGPTETPSNEPTRLGRRALSTHLLARLLARQMGKGGLKCDKLVQICGLFLTYTGAFLKIRNADFQGLCLDYQRILNIER